MIIPRAWIGEFLGTAGLLIVVVGSGIMGETLSQGSSALALLANSIASGAGLYALIQTFGGVSGAHFNPAVSFVEWLWKKLSTKDFFGYIIFQTLGALAGVLVTHFTFGLAIFQLSTNNRSEIRLYASEVIATLGLLLVISLSGKKNVQATPMAVALYITAAYWCTSSTSFANPAVTIARTFTDTFSGIQWSATPWFILSQILGALIAWKLSSTLTD